MIRSNLYKFVARVSLGTNNITREIYPVFNSLSIDRDDDNYEMIETFNGNITLINSTSEQVYDYDFIKECEAYSITSRIDVDIFVGDTFKGVGYFYPYECSFNDDKCTVTVKLSNNNAHNCLMKYWDKKENILADVTPTDMFRVPPTVQLVTYDVVDTLYVEQDTPAVPTDFTELAGVGVAPWTGIPYSGLPRGNFYWNGNYTPNITKLYDERTNIAYDNLTYQLVSPWLLTVHGYPKIEAIRVIKSKYEVQSEVLEQVGSVFVNYAICKVTTTWGFEYTITQNDLVTGAPVPPTNYLVEEWIDDKSLTIYGLPMTLWVRVPYFDNQVYNYAKEVVDYNTAIYRLIDPYIDDPSNTKFIYRGRSLKNTIDLFLDKADCGLSYESEFFNSDTNPVTGLPNKVQHLQLNNCSDYKDPDSDEPATILELSLKRLMDNLANMFDAHWYIDGDKFRIEHRSYFENGYSYNTNQLAVNDLRNIENRFTGTKEIALTNSYRYNKDKLFNKETWAFTSQFYFAFNDYTVEYDLIGDNNERVYNADFYTDLAAVDTFPGDFNNKDIVMIAIQYQLLDPATGLYGWAVVNEVWEVPLFELSIPNGHLSWVYLIPNYWTYGRVMIEGSVGETTLNFDSTTGKKLQSVEVTDCDDSIDVPGLAKTNLGTGRITSSSWDIIKKTKKLEIEI